MVLMLYMFDFTLHRIVGFEELCVVAALVNLAVYRPAWQSTTYYSAYYGINMSANLAVDNNPDYIYGHKSCAVTISGNANPWWGVDLGQQYHVQGVNMVIGDCYGMSGIGLRVTTITVYRHNFAI